MQQITAANYPGGLPTSLSWSGEQWDSPNGWAPANHMIIEGLRKSDSPKARDVAFDIADKWIQTNYFAYVRSGGKMFEKVLFSTSSKEIAVVYLIVVLLFQYNVEAFKSAAGGGGEYEVQEGFGWTNGVLLDLLVTYGDRLRAPPVSPMTFVP